MAFFQSADNLERQAIKQRVIESSLEGTVPEHVLERNIEMVYFCFRYKRKNGVIAPEPSTSHNTSIEVLWSVIPSIFLVYMFYIGAGTYWEMKTPRDDAEEIQVIAFKYGWQFICAGSARGFENAI